MKKFFSMMALLVISTMAWAEGATVGNTDNSSGWWAAFSDYYTMEPNNQLTFTFTNHSDKVEYAYNWLLVVANDVDRGGDGYAEYFVLRADNYGWGTYWSTDRLSSYYNWDTFKDDMDGATVVMTVKRYGPKVEIYADITTAAGVKYWEKYYAYLGDGTQNIRCFLTVDHSHITDLNTSLVENQNVWNSGSTVAYITDNTLTVMGNGTGGAMADYSDAAPWVEAANSNYVTAVNIQSDVTAVGAKAFQGISGLRDVTCLPATALTLGADAFTNCDNLASIYVPTALVDTYKAADGWKADGVVDKIKDQATMVGAYDNSSNWWTAFSDYYTLQPNQVATLHFTNYTDKTAIPHNWIAFLTTDADRDAGSYSEYFVLRADNFGWGDLWDGLCLSSYYNWDTFMNDMNGSDVVMTVKRIGAVVEIYADITTAAGIKYWEKYYASCGDGTQNIRCFLLAEKCHLANISSSTASSTELTANSANGAYWSTYYNSYTNVEVDNNTTIYTVSQINESTVTLSEVSDKIIKAGQGVILKTTASPIALTFTTAAATDADYVGNLLVGNDTPAFCEANVNYTLDCENTAGLGLFKFAENWLPANKAYLPATAITETPATYYLLSFGSESTGIETVESQQSRDDSFYNLNGQRVSNPSKGLYIVNGQKFILK